MVQKKIIIVGATSGIGREIARKYVAMGCRVGITGRRQELLNEMKQEYPGQVVVSCFDVMGPGNIKNINALIEELGGLDLLIFNSGVGHPSTDLNPEREMITTKTNVIGFLEIVCFAFNYFLEKGYGQIALTSSVAALRGNGWAPAYGASKSFMSVYAEGLNLKAAQLKKPITVTDIRPGFLATKTSKSKKVFWLVPVDKAAGQIIQAIEKKRRVAYVSKRWWLVAQLMKWMPYQLYRRIN